MLFDEDRIIGEIRRVAEIVARAVGLRQREAEEEADAYLGELFRALFGFDRETALRLAPDSLAGMVPPQHREAALELLEADGRFLEAQGRSADAALRRAQVEAVRTG